MGMASHIKKGESLLIPFRNGQSISDSQLKPRMYKTMQAFERSFPGHYLGKDGVELEEYAPVVRCKDCKHNEDCIRRIQFWGRNSVLELNTTEYHPIDFCSYGERRTDG